MRPSKRPKLPKTLFTDDWNLYASTRSDGLEAALAIAKQPRIDVYPQKDGA
jgi:hypothetical protein